MLVDMTSSSSSSSSQEDAFEKRIQQVVRQLGPRFSDNDELWSLSHPNPDPDPDPDEFSISNVRRSTFSLGASLSSRVSAVEQSWHAATMLTHPTLSFPTAHAQWMESLQAIDALDPETALTAQNQLLAAPWLYRRQEIMAQSAALRECLTGLSHLIALLSIGQPNQHTHQQDLPSHHCHLSATHVAQAPILLEPRVTQEQISRLHHVQSTIVRLSEAMAHALQKLDGMIQQHHALVSRITETTLRLDSELANKKRGGGGSRRRSGS